MSQLYTLINKEFLEMGRNYKWIWVPIAFVLLGVMDPLTTYYLPDILKASGGLPEGAIIDIPTPSAGEIFITSIGEFETIGILVIVLTTMGTIAGERKSGVAQLVLVKPVSYFLYILAKWISGIILLLLSLFIGLLASWYYTGVLFDFIPFKQFIGAFGLYSLWIGLVITIAVFFSAVFKHPGAAGAVSLGVIILLNLVGNTLSHVMEWSPTQLLPYAAEIINVNSVSGEAWTSAGVTLVIMILLLGSSVLIFKRKELAD
jgi:ABC-2 type transport system permease protein